MPGPAPPPPVVGQPASMLMRVAEFVGLEDIDQLRPAAGPVQLPEGGGALAQEEPDPTEQVFTIMDEQQALQEAWKREEAPVVKKVIERELRALQAKIDVMARDIEVRRTPDSADKGKDPWAEPPPGKKRLSAGKGQPKPNAINSAFVPASAQAFIDKDPTNPEQVPKLLELQVELEALLEAEKDDESKALILSELVMLEQRLTLAGHTLSNGALRRAASHEMWRKLDYWTANGMVQALLIAAAALAWYLGEIQPDKLGFNTYIDFFFSDFY